MKWIIDRIEDDFAVIETENEKVFSIPLAVIPENAKEGDVVFVTIDKAETLNRKERINSLMNDLFIY